MNMLRSDNYTQIFTPYQKSSPIMIVALSHTWLELWVLKASTEVSSHPQDNNDVRERKIFNKLQN